MPVPHRAPDSRGKVFTGGMGIRRKPPRLYGLTIGSSQLTLDFWVDDCVAGVGPSFSPIITIPCPSLWPFSFRSNFRSMIRKSSLGDFPMRWRPIGPTTKSANCNPAKFSLLLRSCRLILLAQLGALNWVAPCWVRNCSHAVISWLSSWLPRLSAMITPWLFDAVISFAKSPESTLKDCR